MGCLGKPSTNLPWRRTTLRLLDCLILRAMLSEWVSSPRRGGFQGGAGQPSLTDAVRVACATSSAALRTFARPRGGTGKLTSSCRPRQFYRDVCDKQKALRRPVGIDEESAPGMNGPAATGFPTVEFAVVKSSDELPRTFRARTRNRSRMLLTRAFYFNAISTCQALTP